MKIDVIGDIHGCFDELCELFKALGYKREQNVFIHPNGRIPVFLGDLTDRGPKSLPVIQLVYHMVVERNYAKYVPGNHCDKLYRYFLGNNVKIQHGLETTVEEYMNLDKQKQLQIKQQFMKLYENAELYTQLKEVNAIVAHAGIKQSLIGTHSKRTKTFVLYGDITGEKDEFGRPVRRDWAQNYTGDTWIVYGHTPVLKPRKINQTINIDTGCVFGNKLTAFQLPEETTVSVPSKQPFQSDRFRSFTDEK